MSDNEIAEQNQNIIDVLEFEKSKGIEKINDIETPLSKKLPIRLIKNKASKTSKLLGNEIQENEMRGKSRWFSFEFSEPLFVERFEISVEGYPEGHLFRIRTKKYDGIWNNVREAKVSEGKVELVVRGIRLGLKFEPRAKYFGDQFIKSINIFGSELREFSNSINSIAEISEFQDSFVRSCDEEIEKVRDFLMSMKTQSS